MTLSLKTTSYMTAVLITLILGFLLLLGSRQYKSHKEYEAVIEQNEKIIFQFATIREHITESLLENRPQQLSNISSEIERLNVNVSQVLQEPVIPDEYRLSFAGQVDFAGIILLLKSIGNGDQPQAKIRQLNQEIRILGERLMLFDRVIVEHVKRKLVGFQNFVIGFLAVVLFIVIYLLLFWQARIGMPLIELAKQAREITSGKRTLLSLRKKKGDVAELAGSFQNLFEKQQRTSGELARYNRVLRMTHAVSDALSRAKTRDGVFADACRSILSNSDYVLVWIGIPGEKERIVPVIADASTTMSRQERDECMAALLTGAEENSDRYDIARQALKKKTPVIMRAVLEGLPKGPFKNTPFATRMPDCLALPLLNARQVYGIISIYSIASESFTDEEIELLENMGRTIVFSLFSLEITESDKTMAYLQAAREKVFEDTADLIMVVRNDGIIVEANPAAENKLSRKSGPTIGADFHEIFQGASEPSGQLTDLVEAGGRQISLELTNSGTEYLVRISPLNKGNGDKTFLVIATDLSEKKAHKSGIIKASRLAAMGELAVGVANEINNHTNGLMNYTQILSEEVEEAKAGGRPAPELLNNIIREGERISDIAQQLLFFNTSHPLTRESVKVGKIVEDSLALLKHQFNYDAIHVGVNFPDNLPSVPGNVQEMQHVFLNLLSNARYALNQRYQGKNPQKRLELTGEVISRDGQTRLKVVCTDYGVGIRPEIMGKVFEPFFSTKPEGIGTGLGLSICRKIVEDNSGSLKIESIPDNRTSVIMELPVAA